MKYYVRVARPIVESITIEVDAADEESAVKQALAEAYDTADEEWISMFDGNSYTPHVEGILPDDEVEDGDPEDMLDNQVPMYGLFIANTMGGHGQLLPQPWFDAVSNMMLCDVTDDWSRDALAIREDRPSPEYEAITARDAETAQGSLAFETWKKGRTVH